MLEAQIFALFLKEKKRYLKKKKFLMAWLLSSPSTPKWLDWASTLFKITSYSMPFSSEVQYHMSSVTAEVENRSNNFYSIFSFIERFLD